MLEALAPGRVSESETPPGCGNECSARSVQLSLSCLRVKRCVLPLVSVTSWLLIGILALSSGRAPSFLRKLNDGFAPISGGEFTKGRTEMRKALPLDLEYHLPVAIYLVARPGLSADVTEPNGPVQQFSTLFHKEINPCGNCTLSETCKVQSVEGYHLEADSYKRRWLGTGNQSTILLVKICRPESLDDIYHGYDKISSLIAKLAPETPGLLDEYLEPQATAIPWCMRETKIWAIRGFTGGDLLTVPLAFGILFAAVGPMASSVFITIPLTVIVTFCILDHFNSYTFSVMVPSVMLTTTLALSLDYTLFILWRFQDELALLTSSEAAGRPQVELALAALQTALMHVGYAVFCSGLLLLVAMQSLMLGAEDELLQALALGATVSVAVCLLVHLTLLPALVVIIVQGTRGACMAGKCALSVRSQSQTACNFLTNIALRSPRTFLVIALLVSIPSLHSTLTTTLTVGQTALIPPGSTAGQAWNKLVHSGISPGVLSPIWLFLKPSPPPPLTRALATSQNGTGSSVSTNACPSLDAQAMSAVRALTHRDPAKDTENQGTLGMLNLLPSKQCEMLQVALDLCPAEKRHPRLGVEYAHRALAWLHGYCPTMCNGTCNNTHIEHLLYKETFDDLNALEDIAKQVAKEEASGMPMPGRWTVAHIGRFRGKSISHEDAKRFVLHQETEDEANFAEAYRQHFSLHVNAASGTAIMEVHLPFDPSRDIAMRWVGRMHAELKRNQELCRDDRCGMHAFQDQANDVQEGLLRGLHKTLGLAAAVMMLMMGLFFKSVMVPIRLLLTVILTVLWTFALLGFICMNIWDLDGVFLLMAAFVVPILVGLTLDYDLLIMVSVLEYRMKGWSTEAAVRQGLQATQMVMSLAGFIMALTFSSLCISGVYALRQFGLLLVVGTLLDAFIMRPFIVPAVVLALAQPDVIWWPRKLPPIKYFEFNKNDGDNKLSEIALDELQGPYALAEVG